MNFDKRLFIWLSISFILATVVGTLSHEGGHYTVAKCLGYVAHIDYESTWWVDTTNDKFMQSTYSTYKTEISAGKDFPEKERYNKISDIHEKDGFLILLGGPLETILTGTIGLFLLFLFRKSFYNTTKLSVRQWILVFISLFWLRQPANFLVWIGRYFLTGELLNYGGDEIALTYDLRIPFWTITTSTAIIGAIVFAIITFKFIPIKQRTTFIVSLFTGGIAGYILWLVLFGKYIMP